MSNGPAPSAGTIVDKVHLLPLRIYYEDTDVGGIVYYANYLKFMERGRSDMLRLAGIDQAWLMQGHESREAITFAVCHCSIDYIKPARFDDEIHVKTWLSAMTGATLTMKQEVWRGKQKLTSATVKAAVLGADGKARRLPPKIRHILTALLWSTETIGTGASASQASSQSGTQNNHTN